MCEGEDLDRMMAEAIALEDKRQATSRGHLFGVDDTILREGHYASTAHGVFYTFHFHSIYLPVMLLCLCV